jgi:protein KRI1
LFEEYNNIDCEDKIAGGTVKTRFRYTNVQQQDFGLTNEEIFMLDDKQLNSLVSLKKYRPYRHLAEDGSIDEIRAKKDFNIHAMINKKKHMNQEVRDQLQTLKQV